MKGFYHRIGFGSRYAIFLMKQAEQRGEHMSTYRAARIVGVSHVAILKMMKKDNIGETLEQYKRHRIEFIKQAVELANTFPCPECAVERKYSISIVLQKINFVCKKCGSTFTEDQMVSYSDGEPT